MHLFAIHPVYFSQSTQTLGLSASSPHLSRPSPHCAMVCARLSAQECNQQVRAGNRSGATQWFCPHGSRLRTAVPSTHRKEKLGSQALNCTARSWAIICYLGRCASQFSPPPGAAAVSDAAASSCICCSSWAAAIFCRRRELSVELVSSGLTCRIDWQQGTLVRQAMPRGDRFGSATAVPSDLAACNGSYRCATACMQQPGLRCRPLHSLTLLSTAASSS